MAKARVTKKWIVNNFSNIITVGYCDMQTLLKFECPAYYTAGVYGWNEDVYIISNDTVICTGYRPVSRKRIPFDDMRQAEKKADRLLYECSFKDYDNLKHTFNDMVRNLIEKAE